ncbi:rhombosortase-dependent M36 family metallopeptidase [Colwellia sp. MB02u-9]|uniref:rhombosortase-dependent M36 family metallopeptidase n=1 Tax=Colwellia sp. MB02u-9 TaxID=2759823 RepID=UPI0015F60579|nr:rhombosortase-dependent M36 family metallopeptidase [Colwellia sp. MB02u-9]MBA6295313.1 rhombosortase-dependent M36 family metallopeptidase [Colwellia sp. MB02u-9]
MNFNKSVIASFVGAALATTALGVAANDNIAYKSFSVDNVAETNARSKVQTASGMINQYDSVLGKTTFQWAGKNAETPDLGPVAAAHRVTHAADFYLNKLAGLSSIKSNVAQVKLANIHDLGRGAIVAKYKQEVAGVEVFNREYNIMMDREFNLVASSGYLADKRAAKSLSSAIKNITAEFGDSSHSINAAFTAMGGNANTVALKIKSTDGKYDKFSVVNSATDKVLVGEPRAKKVFFEHKNKLVAAHYVEIETSAIDSVDSEYVSYVVSARTGEVLFKNNLTSHAADFNYRVYADASGTPWDSPHGDVVPAPADADPNAFLTAGYLEAPLVTLSHGPISTEDAWLADDATFTSGNNVTAYVDAVAPQGLTNGDYMAEVSSANTFDYKYNVDEAEYSLNNRKAAIVNLFYVNNYLHDDYYEHGFDEAAGNAQALNYERGGVEGDALNVEVQDNSGLNNANMSTPADGASPRMQMYLWETTQVTNGVDYGVTVTSHDDIGLVLNTQIASFGPEIYELSGDVVRIDDATDGCEAATNGAALAGKIAIIDRGVCKFTQKVKNAQDAGAIAVLIVNHKNNGNPASMGGDDETVTIASMGLTFAAGESIYSKLAANETVSIDMFKNDLSRAFKDSSWDNGVVAHEWGHYIGNRLVGNGSGLSSPQARSMGEGFGDFHALLFVSEVKDNLVLGNEEYDGGYADTSYVSSFVDGIRPYPYSTNKTINPSMFADIGLYPGEVHRPGSVWGNMLWESFVSMVNDERHTFDAAKSLMKDYLVAGYKMMPMAPTFTEGRDAILAAAYANDREDYKLLLAAFAKRGMGLGAVSPSRFATDHAGAVGSTKTDLATFAVADHVLNSNYEGLMTGYCSNDNILDKGETGTASFTLKNGGNSVLVGLTGTVEVVSDHEVTFANEGVVSFDDIAILDSATSTPLEFTLNEASTGDELVLKFIPTLTDGMEADEYTFSTTTNVDFVERELVGTSQVEDFNTLSRLNDFTEVVMAGGDQAVGTWHLDQWDVIDGLIAATGHSFTSDVAYKTRTMLVGFDGDYSISFWHLYNLEAEYDGAVVEVSVNGGDWADVSEMGGTFFGDGYTDIGLDNTGTAIAGRNMFSGINYGEETINFGENLNGNEVQFRFRIVTDAYYAPGPFSGFSSGWYIDDMTFTNMETSIFSDVVAGDSLACDNRAPNVSAASATEVRVTEGGSVSLSIAASDPNADVLTYSWEQTAGTAATLTGGDTVAVSFTAPNLASGSETLTFVASVNDGTETVTQSFSVTVNDVPAPVAPPKKKSSGSTGLLAFLLLPLALLRRRR